MKIIDSLKRIYRKIFPSYIHYLEKYLKNCNSVLDLGCGANSPIGQLKNKKFYSVGVDIFKPNIEKSKKLKIHNKYYNISVLQIDKKFKSKSFDCVLALDLIEHLTKKQGNELIKKMEKIAKKKVIIFTPNGFVPQKEYDSNPWQVHKSGWTPDEMRKKGYKVIGINGWRPLRGECAKIKFKPEIFWLIVSIISEFFVKNNPEKAFQILCIKKFKQF
ncbi:MAG: methyltransferase domain-containing protein [Candidatus Nanoarchaeia archaeon]